MHPKHPHMIFNIHAIKILSFDKTETQLRAGQGIVNFQTLTLMNDLDLWGRELGQALNTSPNGTEYNCPKICQSVKEQESYMPKRNSQFSNFDLNEWPRSLT
jgi:hypothetical protein